MSSKTLGRAGIGLDRDSPSFLKTTLNSSRIARLVVDDQESCSWPSASFPFAAAAELPVGQGDHDVRPGPGLGLDLDFPARSSSTICRTTAIPRPRPPSNRV